MYICLYIGERVFAIYLSFEFESDSPFLDESIFLLFSCRFMEILMTSKSFLPQCHVRASISGDKHLWNEVFSSEWAIMPRENRSWPRNTFQKLFHRVLQAFVLAPAQAPKETEFVENTLRPYTSSMDLN